MECLVRQPSPESFGFLFTDPISKSDAAADQWHFGLKYFNVVVVVGGGGGVVVLQKQTYANMTVQVCELEACANSFLCATHRSFPVEFACA